ncbi:MAG TPA: uroporphyrinogen-III C-methyltransferase, partial [Solirubrobacteraceae bacterium]
DAADPGRGGRLHTIDSTVNEAPPPAADNAAPAVLPPPGGVSGRPADAPTMQIRAAWAVAGVAALIAIVALVFAWKADQRMRGVEQELVRRQQDSAGQSSEARLVAKQAQESAREAAAKVALLEARVAEVALQRSQLEELMQSLSRSRDENLLVDVEAAIRVALQQTAITGSAEPLVASLKQSEERLARANQPRLEGVRRAIARDLDRVKAASVADISALTIKLDEAIRLVDELPLLGAALPRAEPGRGTAAPAPALRPPASAVSAAAPGPWAWNINDATARVLGRGWDEIRALVRVTRIDHPDAVLLAPDQAFFVKENVKLRLLNARLALLSRQFDTAQNDLQVAQAALDRYFDRASRRTTLASELIRQVALQARQGGVPRPDDTLAALTAAVAGR